MDKLHRWLGIDEIESSPVLQTFYWILCFGFYISFDEWALKPMIGPAVAANGDAQCMPYFSDCTRFYFLEANPFSYAQAAVYAFLTGILVAGGVCAYRKRWTWATLALLPPVVWKIILMVFLTYKVKVDYEYFHIPFVLAFMFCRRKTYFLRRIFVVLYLLAAAMKQTESWVVGSYFSSLKLGLPLFPNASIPFVTNLIAGFEIVGTWFLLSENKKYRYVSVGLWTFFHLYSIILVGYPYPAHCLPVLLVLFLPDLAREKPRFDAAGVPGWAMIAGLFFLASVPYWVGGNQLYTLQSMKFGVGMFDANHQCVSKEWITYGDGHVEKEEIRIDRAMVRCGPFVTFESLRQRCRNSGGNISSIAWRFQASVNGGPFYEIVNVQNACDLEYATFGKNNWIKSPEEGAPLVGYPRRNYSMIGRPTPREIVFAQPVDMYYETQRPFLELKSYLIWFWRATWLLFAGFFAARALGFLNAHREGRGDEA